MIYGETVSYSETTALHIFGCTAQHFTGMDSTPLNTTVCVCVCLRECMMVSPSCSMSFSAFPAGEDVLVDQSCVRIARWPLFAGAAGHSHTQTVDFQSPTRNPQTLSNVHQKKEHLSLSGQEGLQGSALQTRSCFLIFL